MSFSYKLKSHKFENKPFINGQTLYDHLKGVTEIALTSHRLHMQNSTELEDVIRIICMCHDFGKASGYFQKYLETGEGTVLKNHGEISAYFAYYMLPEKWKIIGFIAVKKHHGDIDIVKDNLFIKPSDEEKLLKIINSIRENKVELEKIYNLDLSNFFEVLGNKYLIKKVKEDIRRYKFKFEDYIYFHYIWSLLLTADKTQLIRGKPFLNKTEINAEIVDKYKEKIRKKILEKNPNIEKTELFKIRNEIFCNVKNNLNKIDLNKDHIFSINVPTGTGKTLSVYSGALTLAERLVKEKNISPSIVYCVPFMSVIDQNFDELDSIIKGSKFNKDEELILKHHSLTPLKYKSYDEGKEYRDYDARFCVENWQSTIITTTFVQLMDTIFKAGDNSIIHRFHKLAGSIIILDEVQDIPPEYYKLIEKIFKILTEQFNCYVISVTATKPLFLEGIELSGENKKYFKILERIEIENYSYKKNDLKEFKQILEDDIKANPEKSFLVVLNTVKSAKEIYEKLNCYKRNKLFLSTEVIPKERIEIIRKIKASKEKFILVSTQLIEAGVDIDFDIVYRDFSTIDSINQTAGRANRNGIRDKGVVKLFRLINTDHNNKEFHEYIYHSSLTSASKKILENKKNIKENNLYEINKDYFDRVEKVSYELGESIISKYTKYISNFNMKEIRNNFKLIEEDFIKFDVFIGYEEAYKIICNLNQPELGYQDMINEWKKLSEFRVSVPLKDEKNIQYTTELVGKHEIKVIDPKNYNLTGIERTSSLIF